MPLYALAIFSGAFLLFAVQPLMGKFVLPWFGGGPAVWSACMLFFQAALLLGYAYAHASARWLRPPAQALLHGALLLLAAVLLPITPGERWAPAAGAPPTAGILLLLAGTVGLPYLVLASTGPLLQHWFSRLNPAVSPYRLYSLSNAGSLIALVSYPFIVEPVLARKTQAAAWSWVFLGFAIVCGLCAWRFARRRDSDTVVADRHAGPGAPFFDRAMWLALPAAGSLLLLGVTNKLCLDVAVVPFLWIVPLVVYLLSFIVCFDNPRWYRRLPFTVLLVGAVAGMTWALFKDSSWLVWTQALVYCGGLFFCCMVLHGELYRLRPEPARLTGYYLSIAAGGALGGVLVAVVAPAVFSDYYELHWGLILCCVLALAAFMAPDRLHAGGQAAPEGIRTWRTLACILTVLVFVALDRLVVWAVGQAPSVPRVYSAGLRVVLWTGLATMTVSWVARGHFRLFPWWRALACAWLAIGTGALCAVLGSHARESQKGALHRARNFYGVLSVREYNRDDEFQHYILLQHGRITHGLQFTDYDQAKWPTTYYGETSGVGLALKQLARPRHIGVVGLGTGTLALYALAGDRLRIYEINPEVIRLAKTSFGYLTNCPARVQIVQGDARLSLEREPPNQFDLLALDAFNSDSIPVHLLTREAFELYSRHLAPNGVLAVHISNHYLDLEPVVRALARECRFQAVVVDEEEDDEQWWVYGSTWMLLSQDADLLRSPAIKDAARPDPRQPRLIGPWTDDFSSLWQILEK